MFKRCFEISTLIVLILFFMVSSVYAFPNFINYQGKLTDPSGNLLNGEYLLTFKIYSVETWGSPLWTEEQIVMVTNGIYNAELGTVNPFPGNLFETARLYLEVIIFNTDTDMDETLSPRIPFNATGYSMRAKDAVKLDGYDSSAFATASHTHPNYALTTHSHSGSDITSGTIPNARLDPDLQDLANDGILSAFRVQNGTYFIDSAGKNGQVWKSDGSGKGYWGTDNTFSLSESTVESYIANNVATNYVPRDNGSKLVTGTIYDNGVNVGIGTTSPSEKLGVKGNVNVSGCVKGATATFGGTSTGPTGTATFNGGNPAIQINQSAALPGLIVNGANPGIKVITGFSGATGVLAEVNSASGIAGVFNNIAGGKILSVQSKDAEVFNVQGNGNVGIGTTNPDEKLHVEGDIAVKSSMPTIYLKTSTGTSGFLQGTGTGTTNTFRVGTILSNSLSFYTNNSAKMVIKTNGNVGIGTTSPFYKLHVNGTVYATGAAGALSDLRHKMNISDLSLDALTIVNELRPVTFEWKEPQDSGMEGQQLGFIAQEVEEVLPEAVLTLDNEEQTKGLKYNTLIPLLTKAIQELEARNEALKVENISLRHEIKQIKEAIGL